MLKKIKIVLLLGILYIFGLQVKAMQHDFDIRLDDRVQILKTLERNLILGSDEVSYSESLKIAIEAFCDERPSLRDAGYDLFHALLPYYAQEFDAFFDEEAFEDCKHTDELLEGSYLT